MSRLTRLLHALTRPWHSPPWQAGFYVEARGHSLRTRIGRLLEPSQAKDPLLRRLGLTVVVLAVLLAGWVRVQLVAVAQDTAPGKVDPTAAPAVAASTATNPTPSGPPTKVPREQLTFDGKKFADYEAILSQELAPDRRAEAIRALTAFAPAGYAKEVAEIILAEMASFDEGRLKDGRLNNLAVACADQGLGEIDPQIVAPLLVAAIRDGGYGARTLGLRAVNRAHQSEELTRLVIEIARDEAQSEGVRTTALAALHKLHPRFLDYLDVVREIVTSPRSTPAMRQIAATSIVVAPDDASEFLDRYAREFAIPVQLAMIERGEVESTNGTFPLFGYAPEIVVPQVLAWSAAEAPRLDDAMTLKMLLPYETTVPYLAAQYEAADSDAQRRTLSLFRTLLAQLPGRVISADSERVGTWKEVVPLLGAASLSDDQPIADMASECLKYVAWSQEWRATPLKNAAELELAKRGVAYSDEERVQFLQKANRDSAAPNATATQRRKPPGAKQPRARLKQPN